MTEAALVGSTHSQSESLRSSDPSLSLSMVPAAAQGLLFRMFADPQVLAKEERAELVAQLKDCVALHPQVSGLRVLYGMALCVNLDAQEAMEQLAEAVALAPDSFIAHLKMGELWMHLRVMPKAQDHTRQASLLAENLAQSELARRQAATICTLMRDGVDRNGYRTPWLSLARLRRLWPRRREDKELATVDVS